MNSKREFSADFFWNGWSISIESVPGMYRLFRAEAVKGASVHAVTSDKLERAIETLLQSIKEQKK